MCAARLLTHDIHADEGDVVTSGYVLAQYLMETGLAPGDKVYVIGEVARPHPSFLMGLGKLQHVLFIQCF